MKMFCVTFMQMSTVMAGELQKQKLQAAHLLKTTLPVLMIVTIATLKPIPVLKRSVIMKTTIVMVLTMSSPFSWDPIWEGCGIQMKTWMDSVTSSHRFSLAISPKEHIQTVRTVKMTTLQSIQMQRKSVMKSTTTATV